MPDRFRQSAPRILSASFHLVFAVLAALPVCAKTPQFRGDAAFENRKKESGGRPREASSDGTVKLVWGDRETGSPAGDGGDPVVYELQQESGDGDFAEPVTRYRGPDVESFVSGLPEGTHRFRVGVAETGEWSVPIAVKVTFIDRRQLFLFLGVGFIVVALTVGAILSGSLKERRDA